MNSKLYTLYNQAERNELIGYRQFVVGRLVESNDRWVLLLHIKKK